MTKTRRKRIRRKNPQGGAPTTELADTIAAMVDRDTGARCSNCGGLLSKDKDVARGRHWRCTAGEGRPAVAVPKGEAGEAKGKSVTLYPGHFKKVGRMMEAGGNFSAVVRWALDQASEKAWAKEVARLEALK